MLLPDFWQLAIGFLRLDLKCHRCTDDKLWIGCHGFFNSHEDTNVFRVRLQLVPGIRKVYRKVIEIVVIAGQLPQWPLHSGLPCCHPTAVDAGGFFVGKGCSGIPGGCAQCCCPPARWRRHLFKPVLIIRILLHDAGARGVVFDEPDQHVSGVNHFGKHSLRLIAEEFFIL